MKLFWCPRTRAFRALWMVEEVGQPYELVTIDIRDEAAKTNPDFQAASPMGKVPALEDGEAKLADSAAICLYLADRYPEAGLAPAFDNSQRASYFYWMLFTPGVMEPALAEKFGGWETNKFRNGWGDFATMIETLEAGLDKGSWLLGDKFSAADVMIGSSLYFFKQFGALPENPVFETYIDKCTARPAFKRALAKEEVV